MTIVHVASEVAPFSKTGGLADVAGSLPPALVAAGADVSVVSPCYPSVHRAGSSLTERARLNVPIGGTSLPVTLLETRHSGVRHLFLDCPEFYDRPGIYGDENGDYPDNADRFLLLCRAALAGLDELGIAPAVVHCHDWQTGLLPLILADGLRQPATVFTIHNLGYQGLFPADVFSRLGIPDRHRSPDDAGHFGQVSFLKAGLVHADRLTTVSPTYAREIQEPELGFAMDGVLRARRSVLTGLLNGLDTEYWDPASDPHIAASFSIGRPEGKTANRLALSRELNIEPDGPLFGMVSRLAGQKGVNLVVDQMPRMVSLGARICILGSGQPEYHRALESLARQHPGSVAVRIGFDEALAHRIYAGSDFFLMPSEYEPCGLGQMIALRYGTLPVAARTGGLADTVFEVDGSDGNGFVFGRRDAAGFAAALDRALALYYRPDDLSAVRKRGMTTDFSWDARAMEYLALYRQLAD